MQAQTISIHTETGQTDAKAPLIALTGTDFVLRCTFLTAGRPAAIASLSANSLRLSVKAEDALNDDSSLVSLGAWTTEGSGATTRYVFETAFDSAALRTALGSKLNRRLYAQIAWAVDGEDSERRSFPIEITAINSITESGDAAPDTADSEAWAWLKTRLPAGNRITRSVNEGAQTITFSGKAPTLSRKTTNTNCFSAAYTDLFTLAVEANKVYRLDVSLGFNLAAATKMTVRGYGPAGSTINGVWRPISTDGSYLLTPVDYIFTDAGFLVDALSAGSAADYWPQMQSFIIITSSTAGDVVIQAKSTAVASGVNKSGSWAQLTEIG
jgi:hypothetical protein